MSASLDERYFQWLYSQVCSVRARNPAKTYRKLLYILYTHEFSWIIPNDDNRVEDGKFLRYEFLETEGVDRDHRDTLWFDLPCSFLEFLVALARRAEFESDQATDDWFWEMLSNIELDHYNDQTRVDAADILPVLNRVIWRQYHYNGGGGLFPLLHPERDQRKVEIWYQLSAYILEGV
jgi:hypothetical protein